MAILRVATALVGVTSGRVAALGVALGVEALSKWTLGICRSCGLGRSGRGCGLGASVCVGDTLGFDWLRRLTAAASYELDKDDQQDTYKRA